MVRRIIVLWLILVMEPALAASLVAEVDRRSLPSDEHLILTLRLTNSDTRLRAEGESPNIDLSVLTPDFELGIPREHHRFEIARPAARSTSELRVELFPRHEGRIVIPPFTIDGLSSRPITIEVLPATGDDPAEVFARTGLSNDHPLVHEAIVVYIDFYHRVRLKDARLDGPLDSEPATIDLERLPPQEHKATVDGLEYAVSRMAWALAAQEAGHIDIRLPAVWYETAAGRRERLHPSQLGIEARPFPADIPPTLPIGRPVLTARLSDAVGIRVGSPLSWEILLKAPVLPVHLPSRLPLRDGKGFRTYAERPRTRRLVLDAKGHFSVERVYPVTMVPLQPGALTLPTITIPYYDPGQARIELVHLAGPSIHVSPRQQGEAPRHPVSSGPAPVTEDSVAVPWKTVSLILLALWLLTLTVLIGSWMRGRRHTRKTIRRGPEPVRHIGSPPHDRILEALGSRTLEAGLRCWEAKHGPDERLRKGILRLQRSRYGHGDEAIDEEGLEHLVDEIVSRLQSTPRQSDEPPPPPWSAAAFSRPPRMPP